MNIDNYGKKVKDIEINKKLYLNATIGLLILFNILLACSLTYAIICIKAWYITVLGLLIFIACVIWGIFVFLKSKKLKKYELYENVLVVNSLWKDVIVELKDVQNMKVKISKLDKILKYNTKSITFTVKSKYITKVNIHFIKENVDKLTKELDSLISAAKLKHSSLPDIRSN